MKKTFALVLMCVIISVLINGQVFEDSLVSDDFNDEIISNKWEQIFEGNGGYMVEANGIIGFVTENPDTGDYLYNYAKVGINRELPSIIKKYFNNNTGKINAAIAFFPQTNDKSEEKEYGALKIDFAYNRFIEVRIYRFWEQDGTFTFIQKYYDETGFIDSSTARREGTTMTSIIIEKREDGHYYVQTYDKDNLGNYIYYDLGIKTDIEKVSLYSYAKVYENATTQIEAFECYPDLDSLMIVEYVPQVLYYEQDNTLTVTATNYYSGESFGDYARVTILNHNYEIVYGPANTDNTTGTIDIPLHPIEGDSLYYYMIVENTSYKGQVDTFEIPIKAYTMYVELEKEIPVLKDNEYEVYVYELYEDLPSVPPIEAPIEGAYVKIDNGLDILKEGYTDNNGIVVFPINTSYTKDLNVFVDKDGGYKATEDITYPYMWSYSEKATGPNNGNSIIRSTETGELLLTYYQYNPYPDPYISTRIKRVIKAYSNNGGDWWYVWDNDYGQNSSISITKTTTGEPIEGTFYDNGAGYIYDNVELPNPTTIVNGAIFVEPGSMWSNNITNLLHSAGIKYLGTIEYPYLIHAIFSYNDPENANVKVLINPDGEPSYLEPSYLVIPAHNPSICLPYNYKLELNEPVIAFEDKNSEICRKWYKSEYNYWELPDRVSYSENIKSINPHIDAYGNKVSLVWQEETGIGTDDYRIYLDNGRFVMDNTETDKRYPKIKRNSYISFVENKTNVNMYYYNPERIGKKINIATTDEEVYYPDFEIKTKLIRPFITEHTVYYMFTEKDGDIYKIKTGKKTFTTNDLIQPLFDLVLVDTIENITDSPLEDYLSGRNRPIERLSSTVKGFDENRYYELIVKTTNNNKNTPYVLLIDGEEEEVIYGRDNEIIVPVSTEDILDNELTVSLDRVKGNPNRTIEIKLYEYDEVESGETIDAARTILKAFKSSKITTEFSVLNKGIQSGNYQLEINLPDNSIAKIYLYDIMGREVKSMTKELIKGKNLINISRTDKHNKELSKGIYFIRVETDNNNYTGKLINLK